MKYLKMVVAIHMSFSKQKSPNENYRPRLIYYSFVKVMVYMFSGLILLSCKEKDNIILYPDGPQNIDKDKLLEIRLR